jgi:hypothetical protein
MSGYQPNLEFWRRVKYSFYGTLVFLLITNPMTYRFTQAMFQGSFNVLQGVVPTPAGYFLHAVLFFLLTLAIMMFPRD